jgi:hypothetical protein
MYFGAPGDGAGNTHAFTHASGKLGRELPFDSREVDQGECFGHALEISSSV